jgi:tetratricopeptide (TPR) repeat protein
MATEKPIQPAPHDEWADATAAFQKMLEVMPDDLLALESLFEAYLNQGDVSHALHYLERLVRVLLKENERGIAEQLHEKLLTRVVEIPELAAFAAQLDPLLHPGEVTAPRGAAVPVAVPRAKADIQAELALAWRLFQSDVLSQEDYARVVQDLTDVSARKTEVPVTVLHALNDRSFKHLDKVMTYLSRESGLPLIALGNFEIPHSIHSLLPLEIMSHWGAIVFETLGPDLLVALLNPFDQVLRNEVSTMTGKVCHFYLTSAPDYDKALGNIRKALAEAAKAS